MLHKLDYAKTYTIEEFSDLPEAEDGKRYELWRGVLYEMAPTKAGHTGVASLLQTLLGQFRS